MLLLEAGANVNKADRYGNTALRIAAQAHHFHCMEQFIEAGADVNKTNNQGYTPLNEGPSWVLQTIDMLTKAGADVNILNNEGFTPLMCAVVSNYTECIEKLLKAGSNLQVTTNNGNTIAFAIANENSVRSAKMIYMLEAQINRINDDGQNVVDYHFKQRTTSTQSLMVAVSAGETINKEQRKLVRQKILGKRTYVPEVLPSEDDLHSSLKEICREAIRNHLLDLNLHENLFIRVPLLGLPGPLTTYLLYKHSATSDWP